MSSVSYSTTPHEISFQLQVKDSFLTENRIIVYTNADAIYGSAPATQEEYLLHVNPSLSVTPTNTPSPTITPTPTPGPTNTLTPGPTNTSIPVSPTLSPTPTISPTLKLDKVRIDNIGAEEVLISIITNIDSSLEVRYDLCSAQSLNQLVYSSGISRYHELAFQNLTPDTVYCFQIYASNTFLGKKIQSDIFTFKTAREDIGVRIHSTSTFWKNIRLNSRSIKNLGIPRDVPIVITIDVDNAENISLFEGEFVNRSVLGLTTSSSPNIQKVDFIEIAPGVFSAEIMTPHLIDRYYFTLRIKNTLGSFTKRVIQYSYQVADPIKIIDKNDRSIENAFLQIERFEESRKEYVLLNKAFPQSPLAKSFFQPYYSDQDGYIFVALPVGKYRLTATAIGYQQLLQEFYLGDDFITYPKITLKSQFSISTAIEYLSFSVLTVYEILKFDIRSYFSTNLLKIVLLFYEGLMFVLMFLYGIEKFGLLKKFHSKIGQVFVNFSDELFHNFLGIWSITNVFITTFFILFQGWQSALPFISITMIVALIDIYLYIINKK